MNLRCIAILIASVVPGNLATYARSWGEPILSQQEDTHSMADKLDNYANVRLSADLTGLSQNERSMIPLLIEAADQMDEIFWREAYGEKEKLLASVASPVARRLIQIHYGPWDRLAGNAPLLAGVGPKPPGANFYPRDMTREEFQRHVESHPSDAEAFKSHYTMIRRGGTGQLVAIPYHEYFAETTRIAAEKVRAASRLADDASLRRYLQARAEALLTDQYRDSDMLWMDMKRNVLDLVIGPIETYEDQLFGYKAAHEAFILIKDLQWSERLSHYAELLPQLQRGLPVAERYKQEQPGSNSDLNVYDVIYYAGDANAGAKTIAINLPNDEVVQLRKGTRRLQLKNAMQAKFDRILVPLANVLIAADQREHVTFEAFFGNTLFHEVAHGLGIKNTINGQGTVQDALKELHASLEEGKADILGLYMVTQLFQRGMITQGRLEDNYVTFMAGIFRSVRFGASSAHGRANMLRFNFFKQSGAFSRSEDGTYRVHFGKMRAATEALSAKLLQLQGDGDYSAARAFIEEMGVVQPELQADLERLQQVDIPVDIVFEQGLSVLE